MCYLWNTVFPVAVLIVSTTGARILAVMPTPSYSHQIVFRPLWRELSLRGHQITLITTDPMNDTSLTNITEIDISFAYELWQTKHNIAKIIQDYQTDLLMVADLYINMMNDIMDQELQHPEVQKLIQNEKFDLLMVEYIYPTMIAFSGYYNCPFIGLVPLDALGLAHDAIGNPTNPALYPDFFLPFSGEMNFFERVVSAVFWVWIRYYSSKYVYPREDVMIRKHFGEHMPQLKDMERNISMLFLNLNPVFHTVRPLVPGTISVGGGTHLESNRPLPKDLQEFLDGATEGVIYFSLGTNVKSKDLPQNIQQTLVESLAELPYKVLWKYEVTLEQIPDNIKIGKWLPQQDILRHPNIKLFITQGGLQSMEEGIYNKVPMLAIPFFSDQLPNVDNMVAKGLGLSLDFKAITKEKLKATVFEIIHNTGYKSNVEKYAKIMTDQQVTGLEQGVWWTEYVLRHNGARHLRSVAVDVPFYKFLLLDVIAIFIVTIAIVLLIAYKLFLYFLRFFKIKAKLE